MRTFKIPGGTGTSEIGLSKHEKRRLLFLGLATLLVLAVMGSLFLKARGGVEDPFVPVEGPEVTRSVALPEFDPAELDALVDDDQPADRVVLEGEALDLLLPVARNLTRTHVREMAPQELDEAAIADLDARRHEARGELFEARGYLSQLRTRTRSAGGPVEYIGQLVLEDESVVYVVALANPAEAILGSFVRVDGFFLKFWSDEDPDVSGRWVEGPLLVAPALERSYPALGEVTRLDPVIAAQIEDDVLVGDGDGPARWNGIPFDGLWHLMAYARDLPEDAVDWDAAPELTREALHDVVHDGAAHRFQPYRIPISRLQGARIRRGVENPARIEEFTTGWIGNSTWKSVMHFQAPFPLDDLRLRDYVRGRGFFLADFAYESTSGLRLAPVFVLTSLERYDPEVPLLYRIFAQALVGLAILLLVAFVILLRRDRARARKLHEDLVRRRRARRQSLAAAGS